MKVLARLLAFSFVFLASGCCAVLGNIKGTQYSVYIDPKFSVDQQAAIVSAAQSWEAVTSARFTFQVGPCGGVHDGEICVLVASPGTLSPGQMGATVVETFPSVDGGESALDATVTDESEFQQLAAHEIGHAMGLVHTARGTLMFWEAHGQAHTPTPADVAQWSSLR